MSTIYLVMADVETVDRAFSTQEKARTFVRNWLKGHIYYQQNPDQLTDEVIDKHYINTCSLDDDATPPKL